MPSLEEQLAQALGLECPRLCKAAASQVLDAAMSGGDKHLEAKALACIAHAEYLLSNYRAGYDMSTRAVQLHQTVGDLAGEAGALLTLSHTASVLGRNEEAVEAALLSTELSMRVGNAECQAAAQVQLGIASFYSRNFDAATAALSRARSLGAECPSALEILQAIVVQGACEVVRTITLRHESGVMPSLEACSTLLAEFDEFAARHNMAALAEPDQTPLQMFWGLVSATFHCWIGDRDVAVKEVELVQAWMDRSQVAPWMSTFKALVRCELALAAHDWSLAEREAASMIELADAIEHEQSALLGHLIACHAFERQEDHVRALAEVRRLAQRERRIRTEAMSTRGAVVAWQLGMRSSEQERYALGVSAAKLEKLSYEDPLTGIANRRCFELALAECMRDPQIDGKTTCVALIDVDHFKQVNDVHSHVVGDKVLQVIAALLTEHVRCDDLAARLAGDEFVLLLRRTSLEHAVETCQRIRHAVASHQWGRLADGLSVTLSIGVAGSQAGDTPETMLRRADDAMYANKRATRLMS